METKEIKACPPDCDECRLDLVECYDCEDTGEVTMGEFDDMYTLPCHCQIQNRRNSDGLTST